MDKHIKLAGILNIVYRSFSLLGGVVLLLLAGIFSRLFAWLVERGKIEVREVPMELLDIIPAILAVVGMLVLLISVLGIIAAIAVLKRKEWGRILLLVVAFFSLLRIPLGTLLGAYTIWVLLDNEVIREFNPAQRVAPAEGGRSS